MTPYFIIADDAFSLDKHLMKPFNRSQNLSIVQEIFNYRISRARLTVECAFGRLVSRFRIFHRPIEVKLCTVDSIIKVCSVLHNFLTIPKQSTDILENLQPDQLPNTISDALQETWTHRYKNASRIRDQISQYCVRGGDVPFQWDKIVNN